MTVAAILLALAGVGFFLLARDGLRRAGRRRAAAMAVAVLDRRVFHLALHPYYNQLWGMLTLPFTIVAAYLLRARRRRGARSGCSLAFGVGRRVRLPADAAVPAAGRRRRLVAARRQRAARRGGRAARPAPLWRGKRSLLWIVPVTLLLVVPIIGVDREDLARRSRCSSTRATR